MICLTRLNHAPIVVNAHTIAYIESTPDTMVTLTSGERLLVRESVEELIERAVTYHQRIARGAVPTKSVHASDAGGTP